MLTNEKLIELEQAFNDDVVADQIGIELVAMLGIRTTKGSVYASPRYNTKWGTKTSVGLARSIVRVICDKLTV